MTLKKTGQETHHQTKTKHYENKRSKKWETKRKDYISQKTQDMNIMTSEKNDNFQDTHAIIAKNKT